MAKKRKSPKRATLDGAAAPDAFGGNEKVRRLVQWEVVWEWAVKNHVRGEDWQEVAEKLDLQIKAGQWPKPTLGELDSEVYNGNPERLGKNLKKRAETDHGQVERSRQLVSAALQHVGQVYCDVDRLAPDMLMFDFFKPRQNRIINAGAAISQSKASEQVKVLRDALPRLGANGARTPVPEADPQTIAERSRSTSSSVASQLMVRGGEGTGAARGGALSPVQRAGLVELRVDCGVSISAIPKVLTTCFVILSGTAPTEKQTVSHAHIKDLVLNEHAVDFFLQVQEMLRCLRKHRHIKVHLYHDATTHSDPRAGKYGHLTLYYLSYFDPDKNCAVKFILSCRFTAGGSSLVVARAACVLLSDVRLCTVSRCATNVIAAKLTPEFGNVIGSVVSDNTDSALNVIKDMGGLLNLSSDFSLEFPCATHINALFGKTPIAKVTGAGGGEGVPSFDRDLPANICSKLHYVYNKHEPFLNSVWLAEGKPGGKFPPKPPDSLDGKWETVCLGGEYNMKYRAAWLRIAHRGAHLCIGDSTKASLKKDLDLIVKWLSHSGCWFNFLVMYGWHKRVINPNFYWLKGTDAIYAQSGPGFRRQSMPRFALEQVRIANALPLTADARKSGAVEKKCRDILSEACGPIGLVNNGGRKIDLHRLAPAWEFEVLPAVKQVLLARLPVFGDQARAVCEKHWCKYLRPPWIFFLVTDEAQQHEQREEEENRSPRDWLGPYFARLIVKTCLPAQSCPAADASTFEDEDSKEEAHILEDHVKQHQAEIKIAFHALGLGDNAAKKADWTKLCDEKRKINWEDPADLPALHSFFQAYAFGASIGNQKIEETFSHYTHHTVAQQGEDLKEAETYLSVKLEPERAERRLARTGFKSGQRAPDSDDETDGDIIVKPLEHPDRTAKQQVMRAEQLIARTDARGKAVAAIEGGMKSATELRNGRATSWELMNLREARGDMAAAHERRVNGRAALGSDPFATQRIAFEAEVRGATPAETSAGSPERRPAARSAAPSPASVEKPPRSKQRSCDGGGGRPGMRARQSINYTGME